MTDNTKQQTCRNKGAFTVSESNTAQKGLVAHEWQFDKNALTSVLSLQNFQRAQNKKKRWKRRF